MCDGVTVGSRLRSLHICILRLCSHFSTFCYQQRELFSQKRILKNYFSFRYQKRKLFSLKRKQFFFLLKEKKKIKKFRFISEKEIIIFNSSRIFEEERYYALYCPLKSSLALELTI